MAKSRRRSPRKAKRRTRWTPEGARLVLAEFAGSGMSVGAFAAARGLHPQRLYRWRQRLGPTAPTVTPARTFAEVRVGGGVSRGDREGGLDGEHFEVVLRSGRMVRMGASFDANALRRLVRILDEEDGSC